MPSSATNEGIVFLAGSPSGQDFEARGNAYVVDLTGNPADRAVAMAFDMRVGNGTVGSSFVCMLPDQRAVFISGDRAARVPMEAQRTRLAFYDGRLDDLGTAATAS